MKSSLVDLRRGKKTEREKQEEERQTWKLMKVTERERQTDGEKVSKVKVGEEESSGCDVL